MTSLSSTDEEYIDIEKIFSNGLPNRHILGISHLQMPTKLVKAHAQYKKQMAQLNNLPENEISHRMFHGTRNAASCDPQRFVDQKRLNFCKSGCGVCGIIKEGNRTKYSRYSNSKFYNYNFNYYYYYYFKKKSFIYFIYLFSLRDVVRE